MPKRNVILLGTGILFALLCSICSIGITITAALLLVSPIERNVFPRPPGVETRTIAPESRDKLVWQRDNLYIRHFPVPSPGLITGYGNVAFVTSYDDSQNLIYQLNILDADTGVTTWQSDHFLDYEAFAINKDRAFVLLNEGSPLNVYDINNKSNPFATFDYFDEATQFYMFPTVVDDEFMIYYYEYVEKGYSLHSFDLAGKEIRSPQRIEAPSRRSLLLLFDQPFFLLTDEGYRWINAETGEELWHIPSLGRIDSWPVLQDNRLYISAGSNRRSIAALDTETGRVLWETDQEYGSNVVLHQDRLYALRNDAVLEEITPATGQIAAEIPFSSSPMDAGSWDYWLASDGKKVFVYFGDSQDLFALEMN